MQDTLIYLPVLENLVLALLILLQDSHLTVLLLILLTDLLQVIMGYFRYTHCLQLADIEKAVLLNILWPQHNVRIAHQMPSTAASVLPNTSYKTTQ